MPDGHFTTNRCFGGPGLWTLFVTDAGHGSVLAFESTPVPGHPVTLFRPGPALERVPPDQPPV